MNVKRLLSIFTTVLVLALTLSSCTSQPDDQTAGYPIETLVIGTAADLEAPSRSVYNFDVYTGMLSQLAPVRIDENAVVQPLATEFSTKDSKTWTLTVIENLTWHDGTPVTAEDVKFTIEYLALQEGGEQTTYSAINVLDSRTVELVLPEPNVRHLESLTTTRLIPKHIFESIPDMAAATTEQTTIGCGPYRFVKHDPDAGTFTFEAYEGYVRGKPNVGTIIFRVFGNADTMTLALKAGEIDMVYAYAGGITAAAAADLASSENITLTPVKDTSNPAVLVFNNGAGPFTDINLRRAVVCAVDYAKFRELFGSVYAIPSGAGFVPDGTFGFVETSVLERDLELAKSYLADAGVIYDGTTAQLDGQPLEFTVSVRNDVAVYARYAELLANNLAEIGIKLNIDLSDVPTFRETTEQNRSHEMMISRFTAYGMGMQAGMGSAYLNGTGATLGQGNISDPVFTEIIQRMNTASSAADYVAAAADCQHYYAENLPAAALFWDSYIQAYNASLSGFTIDGTFGILNTLTWYSIKKS